MNKNYWLLTPNIQPTYYKLLLDEESAFSHSLNN